MPHHAGHTTIEMSTHRPSQPSQPSHHAAGSREHPLTHCAPLAGTHAAPGHGNNHSGNHHPAGHGHGLHAGDGAAGISHLPLPSRGHSPGGGRRSPSPQANGSSTSVNHPIAAVDDHLPLLSRPRRALPMESEDALRSPLSLNINTDVPANKPQPLLEPDTTKPIPPLAGPEIDDMDDNTPTTAEVQPGVDDGFFSSADGTINNSGDGNQDDDKKEDDDEGAPEFPLLGVDKSKGDEEDEKTWTNGDEADGNGYNDIFGAPNGLSPRFGVDTPFPYAPEFAPGAQPRIIPDVNVYQQKKNLAQGMMDLALLSANANQLRYVLEAGVDLHQYYYASLIFISASLILQIGVGVGLIVNSTYNVKEHDDICKADRINNFTVIGIFLITVVNVFIASFGVAQFPASTSAPSGSS